MEEYKDSGKSAKEREKGILNEKYNEEYDNFIEITAKTEDPLSYDDLIVLIRILKTRKKQYFDSIITTCIPQKLISTFQFLKNINTMMLYIESLCIIFDSTQNIDIQSILPFEFFQSLLSFFSSTPIPPFSIIQPNKSEKFSILIADLFFILVDNNQTLKESLDKKYVFDTFSYFVIHTNSFILFNRILIWLSNEIEKEDSFDCLCSLLKVFELNEPYFNEPECKPLLICASKFCSLGDVAVDAYLSIFPLQNILSLFTQSFSFPEQLFMLFNSIIDSSDEKTIELIETIDYNSIKFILCNFSLYIDQDLLIREVLDFITKLVDNDKFRSNIIEKLFTNEVYNILIENNFSYDYMIKAYRLYFKIFSFLDFEKKCLVGENQDFVDAILKLVQGNEKQVIIEAIKSVLLLNETIATIDLKLDFSELTDEISDIQSNISEGDGELGHYCDRYLEIFEESD